MSSGRKSRFEAKSVVRLASLNESGRFEMQFSDAAGDEHVVSLPMADAIALGRLICDIIESAPYLMRARSSEPDEK